jgi:hypothetical protein
VRAKGLAFYSFQLELRAQRRDFQRKKIPFFCARALIIFMDGRLTRRLFSL